MKNHSYRYRFARAVPARDIEETLTLALMAVESLHGRARVRMDGRFRLDKDRRICLIDAGTRIGADLAKIFTGYVTREYGEKAVDITRESAHASSKQGVCRAAAAGVETRTTYSMWSAFGNCREACDRRYLKELVLLETDHNVEFGAVIHTCLELWRRHRDFNRVPEHFARTYADR